MAHKCEILQHSTAFYCIANDFTRFRCIDIVLPYLQTETLSRVHFYLKQHQPFDNIHYSIYYKQIIFFSHILLLPKIGVPLESLSDLKLTHQEIKSS